MRLVSIEGRTRGFQDSWVREAGELVGQHYANQEDQGRMVLWRCGELAKTGVCHAGEATTRGNPARIMLECTVVRDVGKCSCRPQAAQACA